MKQSRRTYQKVIITNHVYIIISHINQTIIRIANPGKLLEDFYGISTERMNVRMARIGQADQIQEYLLPSGNEGSKQP
jgi:hypothetical protein